MKRINILLIVFNIIFSSDLFAKKQNEIVFVYENYPPYEFSNESGIDGISGRIVKKICNTLGYKPKFVATTWAKALKMIKTGEADGIFSLNKSKEREQYMKFPDYPIAASVEKVFSINKKIDDIISFEQIVDYSVGVVSGYSYGQKFDSLKIAKKEISRANDHLIDRLNDGWIDLIVMNVNVFSYYINSMKLNRSRFYEHPLDVNSEDLYVAFSLKSKLVNELVKSFSIELKKLPTNKIK